MYLNYLQFKKIVFFHMTAKLIQTDFYYCVGIILLLIKCLCFNNDKAEIHTYVTA